MVTLIISNLLTVATIVLIIIKCVTFMGLSMPRRKQYEFNKLPLKCPDVK